MRDDGGKRENDERWSTMQLGRGTIKNRSQRDGESESDRTEEDDGEGVRGREESLIAQCDGCGACGPGSNCAAY